MGEQEKLRAKTIIAGFDKIGCDALNIGRKDFAAGTAFLLALRDSSSFPFISANIVDKSSGELIFEPYKILERNSLKFGVIGLTTSLPDHINDLDVLDPMIEGKKYLSLLENQTDYQVILLNARLEEAATAKNEFTSADFIFLSRVTQSPRQYSKDDNSWPKLFRLGKQGKALAIVKIQSVNPDSSLVNITSLKNRETFLHNRLQFMGRKDTTKTLEELYSDKPKKLAQIKQNRKELANAHEKLKNHKNTFEFNFVSMNKKIDDDPVLLSIVNKTLAECDRLAVPNKSHRSVIKSELDPAIKKEIENSFKSKSLN
ncbi:MAG: hypothetical protein IIB44_06095 [Candidatus Marinimicrobia bacterium]|nr:hypothetical protein [Candidatus Neomarinimicrobiota bacterium]